MRPREIGLPAARRGVLRTFHTGERITDVLSGGSGKLKK